MDDKQLAQLSALTALNEMMRSGRFSICTVRDVVAAVGSIPDPRAMDILKTVHCVEIGAMPKELREALPKLIERCINIPAYQFQITEITPEQRARLQSSQIRLLTREA